MAWSGAAGSAAASSLIPQRPTRSIHRHLGTIFAKRRSPQASCGTRENVIVSGSEINIEFRDERLPMAEFEYRSRRKLENFGVRSVIRLNLFPGEKA